MPSDIKVTTQEDLSLQRIQSLVQLRSETDRKMSYIWMVVPLLPVAAAIAVATVFVGIVVSLIPRITNLAQTPPTQSTLQPIIGSIVALYGLGILAFFAVVFFGALSFYYLITRRNRHFSRQQLLFNTIHRYLASKTPASNTISQLGYLSEDSRYNETARPAGIWAILFLFLTPIVTLIASYNLTKDMRKHDELQSKYQAMLTPSIVEAGFKDPNFTPYRPQNRDPLLFVILTAITGGLFWIYWYYTMLKDYNDHFAKQAVFEQQILDTLIPAPAKRTCGTCGGTVPATAKFCPSCGSQQTT